MPTDASVTIQSRPAGAVPIPAMNPFRIDAPSADHLARFDEEGFISFEDAMRDEFRDALIDEVLARNPVREFLSGAGRGRLADPTRYFERPWNDRGPFSDALIDAPLIDRPARENRRPGLPRRVDLPLGDEPRTCPGRLFAQRALHRGLLAALPLRHGVGSTKECGACCVILAEPCGSRRPPSRDQHLPSLLKATPSTSPLYYPIERGPGSLLLSRQLRASQVAVRPRHAPEPVTCPMRLASSCR